FDVMRRASWHRFQVLTKRSERMAKLAASLDWPPNVWIDVSVESAAFSNRIDDLNSDAGRRERQHEGWRSGPRRAHCHAHLPACDRSLGFRTKPGLRLSKATRMTGLRPSCLDEAE
ncbi:MAG TPA: hypothetical protein DFS52_12650, partial [Myxococcales bacterium]|nr:hypothetical protein [Myxococcales bacterium]